MSQAGRIGTAGNVSPNIPTQFVTNLGTAVPALNVLNVVGGGGATTTGVGNTITVTVTGSGITWNNISVNQNLSVNNGYFVSAPGGAISLALPAVSVLGDTIIVSLDGAASFTITQGAGQSIRLGNQITTPGVGGSLASTQQGDTVTLTCKTANLAWNVIAAEGNLTIV
jgi:hypothetical protein